MLVFATVAALALNREWGMGYAELIPYATPGFVAFGAFALPAGWLADRWNRQGMITLFFVGAGLASIATGFSETPLQIGIGLFVVGTFAAIYHPVGIALVIESGKRTGMRIAMNGVWGNMGVAVAALLTGFLIDSIGWRYAFFLPGFASVVIGLAYGLLFWRSAGVARAAKTQSSSTARAEPVFDRALFTRVLTVVLFTTALGGLIFQSTTFGLPKVLNERAADVAVSATLIGWLAFSAFAIGSAGQLIVGYIVDRTSPRTTFIVVAALQVLFFALMIGASGWTAVLVAIAFMFATFGQIPINDVLIGRVAKSQWRSRILGLRYTITIIVMASSVPFIAWIHGAWGFSQLFMILAAAATLVLVAAVTLPLTIEPRPAMVPANR